MIAAKRMFASSVVESDQFLDMPGTAQLLYFHLGMRADNDGVVDSAKQIMRIIGAADGDMRVLVEAGYVIVMPDSRIIVITDWRINNNGIRFDSAHNTHGRYYELIKNLGKQVTSILPKGKELFRARIYHDNPLEDFIHDFYASKSGDSSMPDGINIGSIDWSKNANTLIYPLIFIKFEK